MNLNDQALILFKMPLFIFISGFLFSDKRSFKDFFVTKFDGLIKPTFFVYFISIVIYTMYCICTKKPLTNVHIPVISQYDALWFTQVLFASLVTFKLFITFRENQKNKALVIILLTTILLTLFYITQKDIKIPLFRITSVFYFFIILSIGYFFKKKQLFMYMFDKWLFIFSIVVFIICIYYSDLFNIKLNMFKSEFGLLIPTIITFMSGIVIIFNISKILSKSKIISDTLVTCSKSSFFILAFHIIICNTILYPYFTKQFGSSVLVDFAAFVITITLCILLNKITFYTKYLKYTLLPIKSFK